MPVLAEIDIDGNITNIRTAGSQANMRLLKDGFINMGIVQSDVLSEAVNGTGDFNGNKINNVRAVAALYMESFQIIVAADSDIQTPADLKGKKVSVGEEDSGVAKNAEYILNSVSLETTSGPARISPEALSIVATAMISPS